MPIDGLKALREATASRNVRASGDNSDEEPTIPLDPGKDKRKRTRTQRHEPAAAPTKPAATKKR